VDNLSTGAVNVKLTEEEKRELEGLYLAQAARVGTCVLFTWHLCRNSSHAPNCESFVP
jgi:hypothetical protein